MDPLSTNYDDANDQPINYSMKYSERSTTSQTESTDDPQENHDPEVDLFGDYAETDLDQPTDYSLRYAEDDADEEDKQNSYFSANLQEDTVKTYCTEGTPYETPFTVSTATSMSDLRVEDANFKIVLKNTKEESLSKESKNSETTDNPTNYYEEEVAPDEFPRPNSFSSLSSAITRLDGKSEIAKLDESIRKLHLTDDDEGNEQSVVNSENSIPNDVKNKEGKVVTFGGQDSYAEQTPLMFSRCSSLGSLSGFEQHSIHDDRSSIVSDFSRRTSGIVSPSELPDSPTQTVPPSPRNEKPTDSTNKIREEETTNAHKYPQRTNDEEPGIFEDEIATFKEESTPIEFSTVTSVSSLTIDDELKILETIAPRESKEILRNGDILGREQTSDGDEDDDDILAACISVGMQNNRYRQSFKVSDPSSKGSIETGLIPDTVHVYCTEDTPADISPVGSQSNLSALSLSSVQEDVKNEQIECHRNDSSDEGSNLSADDEKILDECIQSGIPKLRQTTPPPPVNRTSEKFNLCGTPLSSPVDSNRGNKVLVRCNVAACHSSRECQTDLYDEESNHSEDEAILTECIRSAMPKVKSRIHKTRVSKRLDMSTRRDPRGESFPSPGTNVVERFDDFEDSFGLSEEEEDIILARCIRSGMPKAFNGPSVPTKQTVSSTKSMPSPNKYNPRKAVSPNSQTTVTRPAKSFAPNKLGKIDLGDRGPSETEHEGAIAVPSRHSSPSSISEDGSLGSIEEWTLLELCITSGMTGNKYRVPTIKSEPEPSEEHEDNFSVSSYNSYICKT